LSVAERTTGDALPKRHRVLLVEDHVLVRNALRLLLHTIPNMEVVGEAGNGLEALQMIGRLRPDIALMDVTMPGLNGIEATRRAAKQFPRTRILVLSMHGDRELVRQALIAGAAGYLVKSANSDELKLALAAVLRGEVWISPSIAKLVVDDVVTAHGTRTPEDLTPRQREVLQLIAEGHTTKQIARRLQLSVKTVETHRAQIMERLGIRNVAGLVRYAIRTGLVPSSD
jgi:DNA-binding NarL/FixJ family response regulator